MSGFYPNSGNNAEMMTITTLSLKDRLNRMYNVIRHHPQPTAMAGLFEYLWDLKEVALIEGRNSVQVPAIWLDELEYDVLRNEVQLSH